MKESETSGKRELIKNPPGDIRSAKFNISSLKSDLKNKCCPCKIKEHYENTTPALKEQHQLSPGKRAVAIIDYCYYNNTPVLTVLVRKI